MRRELRAKPRTYPAKAIKRQCAIGLCDESIPTGFLMCARHWRLVTPAMRRLVYGALERYQASDGALLARDALRSAQNRAVYEVEQRLEQATP